MKKSLGVWLTDIKKLKQALSMVGESVSRRHEMPAEQVAEAQQPIQVAGTRQSRAETRVQFHARHQNAERRANQAQASDSRHLGDGFGVGAGAEAKSGGQNHRRGKVARARPFHDAGDGGRRRGNDREVRDVRNVLDIAKRLAEKRPQRLLRISGRIVNGQDDRHARAPCCPCRLGHAT